MSEINSEVVESVDEMVSVDEDRLVYRVDYIRENLLQLTTKLREKVPQNISDQDLIEDNAFKQWVIVNSIYDASIKDENNDDFNRMLYFLFDRAKGNMGQLINNYDINVKLNSAGQLEDMSLVVLETETYEGDDGQWINA